MDILEQELRRFWSDECPYGDYLNAVDEHLEQLIGRESVQGELRFIAEMQEAMCLPEETAVEIAERKCFPFLESEPE
jgi:hypothetical protein